MGSILLTVPAPSANTFPLRFSLNHALGAYTPFSRSGPYFVPSWVHFVSRLSDSDTLPLLAWQIVGGGVFGTATALSLIKGPYAQHGHLITLLDRSATPPATDAASSDLNKVASILVYRSSPLTDFLLPLRLYLQIIRQEYSDDIYARLAHKAMDLWRTDEWKKNYYETGVVVAVGKTAVQSTYISSALAVNSLAGMETPGLKAYVLESEQDVKSVYPSQVPLGDFARQNVCEYPSPSPF